MTWFKNLLLILGLAILTSAQTAAPNGSNPTAQSTTKTQHACCQKMAECKDAKSCCAHHDMAGKDGESCMKGDKKQKAACAKEGCCKDGDKSTMACCSGGECGMHHDAEPDAMK